MKTMKKSITFILALGMVSFSACNSTKQTENEDTQDSVVSVEEEVVHSSDSLSVEAFDIESIPVSNKDIGAFPFFTAPEGAAYINKAKPIDFDFMVFVAPNSIYEVEGKTFRAHVHPDRKSGKEISGRYLIKSYEDAIVKAGGVKVFEGKLSGERLKQYEDLCTYAGSNGSIDVWNNPIATYVIRHPDGNIYIALDKGRTNTTSIQIVQEQAFEQTIQKVVADNIVRDLAEKGKSILYINFDVDKATLKPDGKEAVNEIAKVLQQDQALKLSVEGHTDNTGNADHNKKLSEDRANAVVESLTGSGIDKSRLKSVGYGAEKPLVANDTEEGKAKNRRVELVKM